MSTTDSHDLDCNHHEGEHRGSSAMLNAALLYAVCLTIIGFILPLSSFVSIGQFSPWSLAGFYIAIYTLAIAFLIFFVAWVARRPPTPVPALPQNGCAGPMQLEGPEAAEPAGGAVWDGAASVPTALELDSGARRRHRRHSRNGGADGPQMEVPGLSAMMRSAQELGVREIPACPAMSQEDSHAPSFFMRVACFIFGSLKVTHETLMIVDTLMDVTGGCNISAAEPAGQVIQSLLSIAFTVLQTFFVFKYCKVSVNVYRNITILGSMHLVGTNLCDWFLATMMETSHSASKAASRSSGTSSYSSSGGNATTSGCSKEVYWRMAPYMLPFTIEYALMAAVSAYALCQNVGKFSSALHQETKRSSALLRCLRKCRDSAQHRGQLSGVSCLRTGRGIIVGAVLFVGGLVSGIYFTVFINDKPADPLACQLIYQVTDLALLSANLVVCVVAYWKMRRLSERHGAESGGPDAWLLGITLVGVLAFQLFQLFGSWVEVGTFLGVRVAQALLSIIQSVFQVFLIFETEHRYCQTARELKVMPGREELAALMLGNAALWIVYTLEIREISSLTSYGQAYAAVATSIVTYTCSPLIIFFRFHSTCCFVEIWRTAYKMKQQRKLESVEASQDTLDTVAAL